MKAIELRHKTPDELSGMLADLKKEQFNLRFQQASGQLENTARVKTVRRDIARVRTILGVAQKGTVAAPGKEQKMAGKLAEKAAKPTAKEEAKQEPKKEGKIAALREKAKAVVKKATAKKAPAKKDTAKKAPAKKATAKKATAKKVTKTAKKPAKAAAKKAQK